MNVQIVRSLCVLLIGFLFLALGDSALSMLVVAVGVLLMIPGVFSLVSYLLHLEQRPMFPLAALGSFVLGLWMVMSPAFFVSFFMYVVGGVLVALWRACNFIDRFVFYRVGLQYGSSYGYGWRCSYIVFTCLDS